jgi:hypothetical protein
MEGPNEEQAAREALMAEARASLRQLKALSLKNEPTQAMVGRGMYEAAASVMDKLDAVIRLLGATGGDATKVPCLFCHRMIAPWTSRCGFCWKRIG